MIIQKEYYEVVTGNNDYLGQQHASTLDKYNTVL